MIAATATMTRASARGGRIQPMLPAVSQALSTHTMTRTPDRTAENQPNSTVYRGGHPDMSTDASGGASEDAADPGVADYDAMLDTLDVAIAECRRKIEEGRVRDAENEKVRIKRIRALAYTVNVRRQVANDRERAEVEKRLSRLEEQQGVGT